MELSKSEKMDRLIKQLQSAMREKGGIPDGKEEDFDKAIEIVFPLLVDLVK